MQRVISLRLIRHPELIRTIHYYNTIVNIHLLKARELSTVSKTRLHKILYRDIRSTYPMFPSALVQCARDNAVEILKSAHPLSSPCKRLTSAIRFDLRTCKAFLKSGKLQLTTVDGRRRYKLAIPSYFSRYHDWRVKGVTLSIAHHHLVLKLIVEGEKPTKPIKPPVLGIDLGVRHFAVCSDGQFLKSSKIRAVQRRYTYLRSRLQARGTRSAKRHLRCLSGRERRFIRAFNHTLSNQLVRSEFDAFAVENLRGIRGTKNQKTQKRVRRQLHRWSFREFQQLLSYKAEQAGKLVVFVDPHYTSQRCSNCLYVSSSNRYKGRFFCSKCNFWCSSDLNASYNISLLGKDLVRQAAVNQPIVTGPQVHISGTSPSLEPSYKPMPRSSTPIG